MSGFVFRLLTLMHGLALAALLPSEHYALMRLYESLSTSFQSFQLQVDRVLTQRSRLGCIECERFGLTQECTVGVVYLKCEQESVLEVYVHGLPNNQKNEFTVVARNLPDFSLSGSLPTEIGMLTSLKRLCDADERVRCSLIDGLLNVC
jgi:hypothetical protein